MKSGLNSNIGIRGDLEIDVWKISKSGREKINHFEKRNQVLNSLITHITKLMGNDEITDIIKIGFGTGSSSPSRTDINLTNKYTRDLGTKSYPAYNQIKWEFTLLSTENNDVDITEYALCLGDDTIITRLVRGKISKKNDIEISGTWAITIDLIG